MTREDIERMAAGEAMNEAVAENLFNWQRPSNLISDDGKYLEIVNSDDSGKVGTTGFKHRESDEFIPIDVWLRSYYWTDDEGETQFRVPDYSGDIRAAWQIIKHLSASFWMTLLTPYDAEDGFHVSFTHIGKPEHSDCVARVQAPTAALAICRASLLAVSPVGEGGGK
jgi:hypothetical protein